MKNAGSRAALLLRAINGIRKVAAGLRPFNESVWPGVQNDLFVAHQSIYHFAGQYVANRSVLDAGTGTGYGAAHLACSRAASVIGIDIDAWSIRYARRNFALPNLRFENGNLEDLRFPPDSMDVVVASNSLEHLERPEAFVRSMCHVLAPNGVAVIAVPPIVTTDDSVAHTHIHYHRSNLHIKVWVEMLERNDLSVECFSHRGASKEVLPNFASGVQSSLTVKDFIFVPTDVAGLCSVPSITAVFVLRRAG